MSKRRASERVAGETSGRAGKLQCPVYAGISGSNAKRAGPFVLGKGIDAENYNLDFPS